MLSTLRVNKNLLIFLHNYLYVNGIYFSKHLNIHSLQNVTLFLITSFLDNQARTKHNIYIVCNECLSKALLKIITNVARQKRAQHRNRVSMSLSHVSRSRGWCARWRTAGSTSSPPCSPRVTRRRSPECWAAADPGSRRRFAECPRRTRVRNFSHSASSGWDTIAPAAAANGRLCHIYLECKTIV